MLERVKWDSSRAAAGTSVSLAVQPLPTSHVRYRTVCFTSLDLFHEEAIFVLQQLGQ